MEKKVKLVPFGKYKGQPIEVMQLDEQYCDWLSQQSWFREKYQSVYNQVIVNNFTEPTETPEHNKLQMKFLNNDFCCKFVDRALKKKKYHTEQCELELNTKSRTQEAEFIIENYRDMYPEEVKEIEQKIKAYSQKCQEYVKHFRETNTYSRKYFESSGWDVILEFAVPSIHGYSGSVISEKFIHIEYEYKGNKFRHYNCPVDIDFYYSCFETVYLEIKPCMGDDFPAVLRQIKANVKGTEHCNVRAVSTYICIIDEFAAEGATFEQVKEMFANEGISLVTFAEKEEEKNC